MFFIIYTVVNLHFLGMIVHNFSFSLIIFDFVYIIFLGILFIRYFFMFYCIYI